MKKKRIILAAGGGAALLLIAALLVPTLLVADQLMHPKHKEILFSPSDVGLVYDEITFASDHEGTLLRGWIIPAKNDSDKWVILSHGYRSNRNIWYSKPEGQQILRYLHDRSINIMTFDYRGCGLSEGDLVSVGYYEQIDLLSAIGYLNSLYPEARIGLMGWSQGSVVSLITAAQTDRIEFVLADSPFRNMKDYLEENLSVWSNLPKFPYTPLILAAMKASAGIDFNRVSPRDSIGDIDVPILLIHALGDTAIPCTNSEILYDLWKDEKDIRLELFPGSEHIMAFVDYPENYCAVLDSFFTDQNF